MSYYIAIISLLHIEEDKDIFYDQLESVVDNVANHDLLLIKGDMNAKLESSETGKELWETREPER